MAWVGPLCFWHVAGKRSILKEMGVLFRWGKSPLVWSLVPMEIVMLRDPKDLRTNVNSKGNREPTEGTLASDSLGRN